MQHALPQVRRQRFLLTAPPLRLRGTVASPVTPMKPVTHVGMT